ncbi:hypothetical protein mRhiFer1_008108 [Rhinolophus ferrumequinum]|uniref:Uncharacterized protein n=1 Tax=Rhinolophus ferrumequinum TaxID=59479 RepID=A0A7J7W7Q3_RHIFE|nr:hypothetical protein mRhiFer1_008108 [Rhinolophus ferrumequinum]
MRSREGRRSGGRRSPSRKITGRVGASGGQREKRNEVLLKIATEMPFPEDAMQKTVVLWKAPLKDAQELGMVGPREEGPLPPHAPLPAEDALRSRHPSAGCSQPVGPARGPAADWLRRRAEVMLLSLAPWATGKPRVSAGRRLQELRTGGNRWNRRRLKEPA